MVTPTVQYLFLSKQRLVIQRLDSMVENAHGEVKTPIEEPRFERAPSRGEGGELFQIEARRR